MIHTRAHTVSASFLFLCSILLLPSMGCEGKPDPKEAAKNEAAEIWQSRCVNCHGSAGKGDGPGAATLDPKPRSFTDPSWQAQASDQQIIDVIIDGGMGVQMSPSMPANPDLADKPEVVQQLMIKIRLMQG